MHEQVEQPEMELAYIELTEEWNFLGEWNSRDYEEECMSGDEERLVKSVSSPKEKMVKKVRVENELSPFVNIREVEC